MNYRARCRDRTCDIRLVRAIASNNINSLSTAERAETGLFEGIRGTSGAQLIRAVIRCECLSCGTHKSRCKHIAGTAVQEFFAKEVGPALAKHLNDQKETIVASYIATIKDVLDVGLKKQAEKWMKDVASDNEYTRGAAIAKLFGAKNL